MAHIIVKNFSVLQDVDMEISNLTVLIGGQASGKSLLAKLVWFFCDVISMKGIDFAKKTIPVLQLRYTSHETFNKLFPMSAWGDKQFFIQFTWNGIVIKIERTMNDIIPYEICFDTKMIDFLSIAHETKLFENPDEYVLDKRFELYMQNHNLIDSFLNENNLPEKYLFIPTGRILFSSFSKGMEIFAGSDKPTKQFARHHSFLLDSDFMKSIKSSFLEKHLTITIKGTIEQTDNEVYIISNDNRKIKLGQSSLGQQELFPMLLSFDWIKYIKHNLVIVEEPEAHLFPETQGVITKYITELAMKKYEDKPEHINRMFVTTHSPYVLSQLNSLLKAGRLAEQFKDDEQKLEEIAKIIPREYWLPRKNVNVYKMENGKTYDLIDKEDGIIDGDYLDSLSDKLMKDYDDLLDIQYDK